MILIMMLLTYISILEKIDVKRPIRTRVIIKQFLNLVNKTDWVVPLHGIRTVD